MGGHSFRAFRVLEPGAARKADEILELKAFASP
jgi:hypothetical protein